MSRRARAIGFLLLAGLAAALAAGVANGYGSSVAQSFGALRPVLVASEVLPAKRRLGPRQVAGLELRRIPARFLPPGAIADPSDVLGLAPTAAIPAGSYLLAAQLRPPPAGKPVRAALGPDRHPVEIAVGGAAALLAEGAASRGVKVDVVVTTEPSGPGPGRTYVAAAEVPLLALGPGADGPGPGGASAATLALTKRQALRLIAAESFARKLTLLPVGLGR